MAISSVKLGTDSEIGIGAAGQVAAGGTFNDFGGVVSGTFSVEHNEVPTTNNCDNGYTSLKLGNTSITLTFECRYDPTDTAQSTARGAALEFGGGNYKGVYAFRVQPFGASDETYAFDGYITSVELNAGENDAPVNLSVTVKGSGPSIDTTPSYDSDGAA